MDLLTPLLPAAVRSARKFIACQHSSRPTARPPNADLRLLFTRMLRFICLLLVARSALGEADLPQIIERTKPSIVAVGTSPITYKY